MPRIILYVFDRFYRVVLWIYPRSYRRVYGALMAQLFRDLCRDAYARRGIRALPYLWLHILLDAVITAAIEHLAMFRRSYSMQRKSLIVLALTLLFAAVTGYVNVTASEVQAPMLCLLTFAFVSGFIQPKAAWRWAVVIGLSIPVSTFVALAINYKLIDAPHYPITLAVLVIPALIAAYVGVLFNRVIRASRQPEPS